MASNIYQIVSDPDFAKLSAAEQQGVLAHFDKGFAGLSSKEIPQVVEHFQKQAMSRPDLVAPPGLPQGLTRDQAMKNVIGRELGGGNNYQAADGKTADMFGVVNPDETTPEAHAAAVKAREAQVGPVGQVGIGFAKGAGQTFRPVDHLVKKLVGDNSPDEDLTASNGYQSLGKGIEGATEFMAGDELLKGLGLASEFRGITSPTARAAARYGVDAVRRGVVGGVQDYAHNGDLTHAAESAGMSGIMSFGLDSALGGASAGLSKVAETAPGKYINNMINTTKGFLKGAKGVNVGEFAQSEGVTATSPVELEQKMLANKQQIGQDIQNNLTSPKYANSTLDVTPHLDKVNEAINAARRQNNLSLANELENARNEVANIGTQDPQGNWTTQTRSPQMPPSEFNYVKGRLGDIARSGTVSDQAAAVLRGVSGDMNDVLTNLAPEMKTLGQRYGTYKDLLGTSQNPGIISQAANLERNGGGQNFGFIPSMNRSLHDIHLTHPWSVATAPAMALPDALGQNNFFMNTVAPHLDAANPFLHRATSPMTYGATQALTPDPNNGNQ
jgi:hypothetical protein